eukprot:TRINITY_DN24738_c0_g1_i1.p1 TRINITY_DN24738_c0_g1~~TRINITY_DN24738_c0_g1_i1.p1  ORF type:complete len:398 (+),score=72.66 TRINITY_DN24738_c0_g1_i1:203-1396(+)
MAFSMDIICLRGTVSDFIGDSALKLLQHRRQIYKFRSSLHFPSFTSKSVKGVHLRTSKLFSSAPKPFPLSSISVSLEPSPCNLPILKSSATIATQSHHCNLRRSQQQSFHCARPRRRTIIARQDGYDVDDMDDMDADDVDNEMDEDEMDEDGLEYELEPETALALARGMGGPGAEEEDEAGGRGVEEWTRLEEVDYTIDVSLYHKIEMHQCDFFIRRVQDPHGDLYNFQDMYVTEPGSTAYSIPRIKGSMPTKPLRCQKGEWVVIVTKQLPFNGLPRSPEAQEFNQVAKVFLIKHYLNRRDAHPDFVLDFEEIYVIAGNDMSIQRADVKVEVPGGKRRDRNNDALIVRDNGTTFKIIPEEERKTPEEIVQEHEWDMTYEKLEKYLRGFRDFEKSNWF